MGDDLYRDLLKSSKSRYRSSSSHTHVLITWDANILQMRETERMRVGKSKEGEVGEGDGRRRE